MGSGEGPQGPDVGALIIGVGFEQARRAHILLWDLRDSETRALEFQILLAFLEEPGTKA